RFSYSHHHRDRRESVLVCHTDPMAPVPHGCLTVFPLHAYQWLLLRVTYPGAFNRIVTAVIAPFLLIVLSLLVVPIQPLLLISEFFDGILRFVAPMKRIGISACRVVV